MPADPLILATPAQLEELVERAVRKALGSANEPAVLSTAQAASRAGRSEDTVREWIASGALPASKRGRVWVIHREDLDRYLAGERRDAGPSAKDLVASLGSRKG